MVQNEGTLKARRLVFVSHCGQDTWVARQIAREIEQSGAKPFLDEAEINAGADFEEDIRAELQNRPGIPVLLKKRDLLELNNIETYLEQLQRRSGS